MAGRKTNAERERERIQALRSEGKDAEGNLISEEADSQNGEIYSEINSSQGPTSKKKEYSISDLKRNIDNSTLGQGSEPKGNISSPDDPDYIPLEPPNPMADEIIQNESDANTAARGTQSRKNGAPPPADFAEPIIEGGVPTEEPLKNPPPPPPIAPDFDKMSPTEKRKQVEMFADAILGSYAEILPIIPKLFVKYNMDKMELLDKDGIIRLSMIVGKDENEDLTIRAHMNKFNEDADKVFVVTDEMKAELREPLIMILMDKGVAPTPMTTLLVTVGKHCLTFAFATAQLRSDRNNALKTFAQFRKDEIESEKNSHRETQFGEEKRQPEEPRKRKEDSRTSQSDDSGGIKMEEIFGNNDKSSDGDSGNLDITDVTFEEVKNL